MKEHYVSYEQAVKLKELGFDWECDHSYLDKTIDKSDNPYLYHVKMRNWNSFDNEVECFSGTRLDQAQAWLREVKELHVLPRLENVNKPDYVCAITLMRKESIRITDSGKYFPTYELALSDGIDKALELLGKEVIK